MTTQIIDIDGTPYRVRFEGSIEVQRMFDEETVAIRLVGDSSRLVSIEEFTPEEAADRARKRREGSQIAVLERRMSDIGSLFRP